MYMSIEPIGEELTRHYYGSSSESVGGWHPKRPPKPSEKVSNRRISNLGFDVPQGDHPIVPIMLGDAGAVAKMAALLLEEGVYVVAFSYPVVPKDKARIRVQISAAHSCDDLDFGADKFAKVKRKMSYL